MQHFTGYDETSKVDLSRLENMSGERDKIRFEYGLHRNCEIQYMSSIQGHS